jgi:DNA polymerase III sliding clamp (beta) subunit (PCNA family)
MKFRANIKDLYTALNAALIHASKDYNRPHMHCVCISIKDDSCHVVGTDGQRLAVYKLTIVPEEKDIDREYLLNYDDVKTLIPILKKDLKTDFTVPIEIDSDQVDVLLPMNRISIRTVDQSSPPWQTILEHLPKNKKSKGLVGLNAFFMRDVIKAFGCKKDEAISIQVNDELDPVIITAPKQPNLTIIIMPMRI